MGFNLKMFFADLITILSSDKTDFDKVQALIATVAEARKYAEKCGMLK